MTYQERELFRNILIAVLAILLFFAMLFFGAKKGEECENKGGVLVRGVCIKKESIIEDH